MTHNEKIAHFIQDMMAQGHKESKVAPPIFKGLWKIGIAVRPPLFATFTQLMAATGITFGLLWGAAMWFLVWQAQGKSLSSVAAAVVVAGLFFGVTTAWLVRRSAKKLALPAWEDYPRSGAMGPDA